MKTGIILYIAGSSDLDDMEEKMDRMVKNSGIRADRIEMAFGKTRNFDVIDAWWRLTAKGMQKIVCAMAEIVNNRELKLTGRELRLCG